MTMKRLGRHTTGAEIVEQMIALRTQRRMTQTALAQRAGTAQPSIARMEKTRHVNDLAFVGRIARALDARLDIRLVPREEENE